MRRRRIIVLAAAASIIAALMSAAPAHAATTSARNLLMHLAVRAENGSGYSRSYFGDWRDANGDCQNTRAEVLIAESKIAVTYTSSTHCTVKAGRWYSRYDGKTWTLASDVDIDDVVALKEAWDSGAKSWSSTDRSRFHNDLGYAWTLDAVTDNVNSSKGDSDPAQWLPPLASAARTRSTGSPSNTAGDCPSTPPRSRNWPRSSPERAAQRLWPSPHEPARSRRWRPKATDIVAHPTAARH